MHPLLNVILESVISEIVIGWGAVDPAAGILAIDG
jgi:hypothetical protein